MKWEYVANGKIIQNGVQTMLNVEPQQTKNYQLPPSNFDNVEGEVLLNIYFLQRNEALLVDKKQVVAYNQFVVKEATTNANNYIASINDVEGSLKKKDLKLKNTKNDSSLVVNNSVCYVSFNNKTGFINHYSVQNNQFIANGGTLKPNFWRAVTDNDMGAGLQKDYAIWRNPSLNLKQMICSKVKTKRGNNYVVITHYDMPQVGANLSVVYTIYPSGQIDVEQTFEPNANKNLPDMFRFGMVMQMPYNFSNSLFYGRGPIENYCDRKESQLVGLYNQNVDQQYYPYIRPQETGLKSDIRYWKQINPNTNTGLCIVPQKTCFASALHYSIDELDEGLEKKQRHGALVKKDAFTNLFIDAFHAGLGGADSWSKRGIALPQYRVKPQKMTFKFSMGQTK